MRRLVLCAVVLSLLTSVVAVVDTPLEIANSGFEDWVPPAQADPLWSLPDKLVPAGWLLESYKGAADSLRPVANDAADAPQLGEHSLRLDG